MVVSWAFSPPSSSAIPSSSVAAPAPLVARGRSGNRTHAELSRLKQSTRRVAGERPPAAHTLAPKTNPDTWFRGEGSAGRSDQTPDDGSYTSVGPTFTKEVLPPMTYSRAFAASSV